MIFQALGAKYTFGATIRHLFTAGTAKDTTRLRRMLETHYRGEDSALYHKGRAALAEAVRLATGGTGSVAVSGLTCYSVVQAVEAAGCTPVFVDIAEGDLHFSGVELKHSLEAHTDIKAVIIHNMLGIPVDIASVMELVRAHDITLIEDLAHSAGASYADGREVGTVGDFTVLSFGRDKAIDVVNGGALVVRQPEGEASQPTNRVPLTSQLRDRLYPSIAWFSRVLYPVRVGPYVMALAIKLRLVVRSADGSVNVAETLPHWQARLARTQLQNIKAIAVSRREKANQYLASLSAHAPAGATQEGAALIRVPLLVGNRDEVVAHLRTHGVQAHDIWYDVPVSPQRFYDKVEYPEAACPVAVQVAARLVNLPTHERITAGDIERITKLVLEVAKP